MQKVSKNLAPDEVVVLSLKYQSRRIGEIPGDELQLHVKALLLRINAITGWRLPEDEFYLNTLESEFEKFLIENYADLNPDEITYAFRTYGTTVKDWGKNMNLSLIDEPINKYLSVRKCLSEIEERTIVNEERLLPYKADFKELAEYHYQKYLSKEFLIDFCPVEIYEELVSCGFAEKDVYEDFIGMAQTYLITKKQQELAEAIGGNNESIVFRIQREVEALKTGNEMNRIENFAKRYAIRHLYERADEFGMKNLFVQV